MFEASEVPVADADSDIFRGEPPASPHSPCPSHLSHTSTSSSGSYFGRLGALATAVELAISRWAGNESSSSSSTTGSSRAARLNKSEQDISARISRRQAREGSRQIARQFSLYLPPSLASSNDHERNSRTTSLPSILEQLDTALKKSTRIRRQQGRERSPKPPHDAGGPRPGHLHFMLPNVVETPSRPASLADLGTLPSQRKGKDTDPSEPQAQRPKAWFLDVSSPTEEDMRAIGKLLHLHPLTLEDIVMQDPREKLEHFQRLGYYFVSFRAIESWQNRGKSWTRAAEDEADDDGLGEASVYLVVFKTGICIFHFTDISEHTDRVRNRAISLEQVVNMSSDSIAHILLDSIVDGFFPFLDWLEKEVMAIENVVFSGTGSGHEIQPVNTGPTLHSRATQHKHLQEQKDSEKTDSSLWQLSEKNVARLNPTHPRLSVSWPWLIMQWRPARHQRLKSTASMKSRSNPTLYTLHRMARARRLVTSISRLLGTKSEVVTQLRKRLMTSEQSKADPVSGQGDSAEVAIYMGDVQDHILTLENALGHYERILSQSHPIYISHIRTTIAITKAGSDKAFIFLSSVSIAVLCLQTLIGVCSMNVNVPSNATRFNVFGIVLALAILILLSYLYLVRSWWRARRKRRRTVAL